MSDQEKNETAEAVEEKTEVVKPKKKKSKFKLLLKIFGVLLALLIIIIVVLSFTYDKIVSKAVSTIGSQLTGTEVKLEKFSLSLFQGKVTIGGFSVANPKGYQTPYAVKVKELIVDLDPATLLSNEINVEEIKFTGLAISYEQGLTGNNLFDIKNTLEKNTKGEAPAADKAEKPEAAPPAEEKPGKKVKVTVIRFVDGNITVAAKSEFIPAVKVPMANFDLHPDKAMSWAELASTLWDGLYTAVSETVKSSANVIGEAGKKTYDETKKAGGKLIDGVKSLF